MTGPEAALTGIAALLALMALRIPIGVAMIAVGWGGYALWTGPAPLLAFLKTAVWHQFSGYGLSVIPLFVLMGEFAAQAGLSARLYRAAAAFMGHWRGGLAMASIGGCAGFGAICGSSLATAATMGRVALPQMRSHGYGGDLATGALAAGGALGVLIPPSVALVLYALMAEQSVASLFVAAIIPGVLAALGYLLAIAWVARRHPAAAPAAPRADAAARWRALGAAWPILALFALVVGGLQRGWFTPTEAASVGACGAGLLAAAQGGMRLAGLAAALRATAATTGMIFLILLGAESMNAFLAQTRAPLLLAEAVARAELAPMLVLLAMLGIYLALGCVMDSLSMLLLTAPIFLPIVSGLEFGLSPDETLIWFGVLAVVAVEIGLITPPVGLNVFVINALARDVPLAQSFRGVTPFLLSDLLRLALLIAVPALTLGLGRLIG